jgi:hypothetical protein
MVAMKSVQLFLISILILSISLSASGQIGDLKKLGKPIQQKSEKALDRPVDPKTNPSAAETTSADKTLQTAPMQSEASNAQAIPGSSANIIYVSKTNGSNRNEGSKDSPLKNLDKAIDLANQWRSMLGMNLQGTMTSSVTMFANKYPWQEALSLFGNVSGFVAQQIKP